MQKAFKPRRSRVFLGLVLFAALAVRLYVAWQPVETLVTKNLPDDAFYYFEMAQRLAAGGGVSVDGINPTNGFHPLWLLLITPVFAAGPEGDLPIHLSLSLAALMDAGSVFLLALLVIKLGGRWQAALAAAALYAFNPMVILQATNGLETAAGVLTLLIFLLALHKLLEQPSLIRGLWLGACGGLMLLARSDSFFVFAAALLALVIALPRKLRWPVTAAVAAAAFVAMLPWLLWSYAQVGGLLQESGLAVPYAAHQRFALEHGRGLGALVAESVRQVLAPAIWLRGDFTGLPLLFGALLWIPVLWGLFRTRKQLSLVQKAVLLPLVASGALMILFHAGLRWYPRLWYFVPLAAAFALSAALLLERIRPRRLVALTGGVVLYFALSGLLVWRVGLYPWQKEMWAAKDWLAANARSDEIAASFNSGIYAYYNEIPVVNLDGVVNHNAYQAVLGSSLFTYMQQAGVDYLIDTDRAVNIEYAPFMGPGYPQGLQPFAVLSPDADFGLGALRVYRVAP